MFFNLVGMDATEDDDLFNAGRTEKLQGVIQQWNIDEGQQGLEKYGD